MEIDAEKLLKLSIEAGNAIKGRECTCYQDVNSHQTRHLNRSEKEWVCQTCELKSIVDGILSLTVTG